MLSQAQIHESLRRDSRRTESVRQYGKEPDKQGSESPEGGRTQTLYILFRIIFQII